MAGKTVLRNKAKRVPAPKGSPTPQKGTRFPTPPGTMPGMPPVPQGNGSFPTPPMPPSGHPRGHGNQNFGMRMAVARAAKNKGKSNGR